MNELVLSVLQYGSILYACLSNVESALDHANVSFSKAEGFFRRMLRWALSVEMDKKSGFLYELSD